MDRIPRDVDTSAAFLGRVAVGAATIHFADEHFELRPAERASAAAPSGIVRVDVERIERVSATTREVVLRIARDADIAIAVQDPRTVAADVLAWCRGVPEVARGLRGLRRRDAAAPGVGANLDATFFRPLLSAKGIASTAQSPEDAIAAFNGAALADQLRAAASKFAEPAGERSAAHRRALEAEFLEHLEPLLDALTRLAAAAELARHELRANNGDLDAWHSWSGILRDVFREADRAWIAIRPSLPRAAAAPTVGQ